MRAPTIALALLLLTSALAGCTGGERLDASSNDDAVDAADAEETDGEAGQGAEDEDDASDEEASGGTSSEEDGNQTGEDSEEGSSTVNETETGGDGGLDAQWFNGTVQGMRTPAGVVCLLTCDNEFSFGVSENATALIVEMAWDQDAGMMLDVDVPEQVCDGRTGDCPPNSTSGEEGYLVLEIRDAEDLGAGEWSVSAWAEDSPLQPVDFTIVASAFTGDTVPDDYGKVDDA